MKDTIKGDTRSLDYSSSEILLRTTVKELKLRYLAVDLWLIIGFRVTISSMCEPVLFYGTAKRLPGLQRALPHAPQERTPQHYQHISPPQLKASVFPAETMTCHISSAEHIISKADE